jgi:hypothetical protein
MDAYAYVGTAEARMATALSPFRSMRGGEQRGERHLQQPN